MKDNIFIIVYSFKSRLQIYKLWVTTNSWDRDPHFSW